MLITFKINKKTLLNTLPLILFHILCLILFIINFAPGKFLVGWDSVHPEFDYGLNFRRALFGSWQENYGVGLLGGHGFSATLPHTAVTYLMSFIVPQWAIRQVFTFLCFYLGGFGMFLLLRDILARVSKIHFLSFIAPAAGWLCLIGALYYQYNLGIAQQFYLQLEAFIIHFAAFPWLFYALYRAIRHTNKKNIALLLAVNFLASGQGFIPPLFIVYLIFLFFLFAGYVLSHKEKLKSIKKSVVLFALICFVNLYWAVPFTYYTLTLKNNYITSYNNLISTPEFTEKTKKYGSLKDVALLKGFYLDSNTNNEYIFQPWLDHYRNELTGIVGYGLFSLIVIGFIVGLVQSEDGLTKGLLVGGLICFVGLAVDTAPFSYLTQLLQSISAGYRQAFRIAFTKFSVGLAFSYSIWLTMGIAGAIGVIKKAIPKGRFLIAGLLLVLVSLVIYLGMPLYGKNLMYGKSLIQIPKAYFTIMDYFKRQGDGRIADFPQDCPEGWYATNWGYFGSGFYWYGIKQPFMSRTFDVWHQANENYYWEIAQALKSERYDDMDKIFKKYGVTWVLYDPNFINCRSPKAVFGQENFIRYLEQSDSYTHVETFQSDALLPIKLFKRNDDQYNSFVTATGKLPNIGPPYQWSDEDVGYRENEDYITDTRESYNVYYPFRSLFTGRGSLDNGINVTDDPVTITFASIIPKSIQGRLSLPDYAQNELFFQAQLSIVDEKGKKSAYITPRPPTILVNTAPIASEPAAMLGTFMSDSHTYTVYVNGDKAVPSASGIYQLFLSAKSGNSVDIVDSNGKILLQWREDASGKTLIPGSGSVTDLAAKNAEPVTISVQVPKTGQAPFAFATSYQDFTPVPCNEIQPSHRNLSVKEDSFMRLSSREGGQCIIEEYDSALHGLGYLLKLTAAHVTGSQPAYSIISSRVTLTQPVPLDLTTLNKPTYYIVPPSSPNGLGYSLNIQNRSFDNDASINDFSKIELWTVPSEYMKMIRVDTDPLPDERVRFPVSVSHANETQYTVRVPDKASTLILSQSFHPGWKAYRIAKDGLLFRLAPFIFGNEIPAHVTVNNWSNGWLLNDSATRNNTGGEETVVIVFWPQYLQFIGYVILLPVIGSLLLLKRKN